MKHHIKKFPWLETFLALGVVAVAQLIMSEYILKNTLSKASALTIIAIIVAQVLIVWVMISMQKIRANQQELNIQSEQIRQIESLYASFRAERHDLINHVQTIYGFLYANNIEQARSYLKELSGDMKAINDILLPNNPSLSAMLQVKSAEASRKGIELDVALEDSLVSVSWTSTEGNTVIGNIINNAIEAFEMDPLIKNKRIWIRSHRIQNEMLEIVVGNSGPLIEENMLSKLKDTGVSSKKGHSGIGLASVADIVSRNGGTFEITSNAMNGTCFTIRMYANEVRKIG